MSTHSVHRTPTPPTDETGPNGHAAWRALYHALRVLPVAQVVPHEEIHPQRVADLADRLAAEGRLVNPPVAAPLNGKYVVLDGATRLTALQRLGCPHVIVQVVDPTQAGLQLHTWHHVVRGGPSEALLERLRQVDGLAITSAPDIELHPMSLTPKTLAHLVMPDGHGYRLGVDTAGPGSGTQRETLQRANTQRASTRDAGYSALAVLNRVVEAYGEWGNIERTLHGDLGTLTQQYRDLAGLVILPQFSVKSILDLAVQGRTIPAGITRFVIPGRILRLNAPLAKLCADEPPAVKQQWLDALVREKIAYRQVRYYEEPVVLLDE